MRIFSIFFVFCFIFLAPFSYSQEISKDEAGAIFLNSSKVLSEFPLSELRQCADIMTAMQVLLEEQKPEDSVKSGRLSKIFLTAAVNKVAMQGEDVDVDYTSGITETLSVMKSSPDGLRSYLNSRSNACVQVFESKLETISALTQFDMKGMK